jgi:iron complex transport system substrate-binding protein
MTLAASTTRAARRFGVALLAVALAWVAGAQTPTRTTDDRGRVVELTRAPQRIVSLLPSLTESVCELGACDRLVGVDRFSNWPAQAAALPRVGGLEDAQIERIVALKPDLVLAAQSSRAIDRLEALGLTVIVLEPRSLAQARSVLEKLALVLGRPGDGEALWQRIEARIAAAAARVPSPLRGERVYFEVAAMPYAASEASFVGELLARMQLRNVVPGSLGPFPKLNPEFVVRAKPGLVMASAQGIAEMHRRPGWAALPALRSRRLCAFDLAQNDVLMRAGPRLGEAADVIADCLVGLGKDAR